VRADQYNKALNGLDEIRGGLSGMYDRVELDPTAR
jgi:hypothetical protein